MDTVLVITPHPPQGLPPQGLLVAERLNEIGVKTSILSRARSGWGRLLDVAFRGLWLVPAHDVVLVNVFGEKAFVYESLVIVYGYLWKRRVVVIVRSGCMPEFVMRWPRWASAVLSRSNLVLVPHGFLRERLSALGVRIDGIIPNFIQLENYKFRERSVLLPRFLYLRRMHPHYNPAMALRAFAIIQRSYPDASLTMAGPEDEDSQYCKVLVRELNLRNVHFAGVVPKEEIPALADKHDIHLHTNRVENMPVTIIEMWACGLPIIGTNVGGMPYLIRNRLDGVLVDSEDYKAMAAACLDILSDSELAKTLSSNGRARAQALTWENVRTDWQSALFLDHDSPKHGDPYKPDISTTSAETSRFPKVHRQCFKGVNDENTVG